MRLLLDTCTFLWVVSDPASLSSKARVALSAGKNELYLSSISTWEICAKYSRGLLPLPIPPPELVARGRQLHDIQTLPFEEAAAARGAYLPWLHKDPFDRILVCQALAHDLTVVTPDQKIKQYQVPILW